ncbi:MAG: molybdopterin-dependent oxidoreductase [Luteimonas sp.]|nr:molybdopterin-dependent oxidoreductase [Luteimonas sp.]
MTPAIGRKLLLVCAMLWVWASAQAMAQESGDHPADGRASEPEAPASPLAVPIDATTLAGLTRESVTATAHDKKLQCEGVSLTELLRASKAMPAEPLRGARLASYVLVTARDGYRAVYSLAELDPTLGNRKVLLVDRCDGKPLDDEDGPLRLIAPEDARPARWVRQVQSITVVAAP